jgi:hypothetical protein
MPLYQKFEDKYVFNDIVFKLDLCYGNILKCLDIENDLDLFPFEKIDLMYCIVVKKNRNKLLVEDKNKLLKEIFDNLIFTEKKSTGSSEKTFDFLQDEEYIYSSFMECYGIDLYDVAYKMHWKKFMALFKGLNSKCKIKEIIDIRTRKVPEMNKNNMEQVNCLLELKRYYSLTNSDDNYDSGIKSLFGTLKEIAKEVI